MHHRRFAAPYLLLFLVGLVTCLEPARAQSCGACAGPPPTSAPAAESSWLAAGRGWARLSEEYEVKDRSFRGAHAVDNDFHESLFVSRTALDVRYGLTDEWSADVLLTYPHFTYRL